MTPEILSPAGNLEKLKYALLYGADAVYIGWENYSLRANAGNFTIDEIREAVEFSHKLNKKIYVTVNMILHNIDLEGLDKYLITLNNIGVDAIIVSDMAVIKRVKDLNLNIPIHISTQESTTNKEAIKFLETIGVERVVLARECSKEDIIDIKQNTNMQIEMFIHGAMCTSYSGRCVLSNYVTKRDSNRGGCSQVCRYLFNMDGQEKNFMISSKDLCMTSVISELVDLEVDSLKIEGRMRSIYYIATVVSTYKKLIILKKENKLSDKLIKYYINILRRCSNRENTVHFYDKLPSIDEQYYEGRDEATNKDFLGIVLHYDEKSKYATIEQRNYFKVGDIVEIMSPNIECFDLKINKIVNELGEEIDAARHPQEIIKIKINEKVSANDILRLKTVYLDKI